MSPTNQHRKLPENPAAAALDPYQAKRDFTVTPEPAAEPAAGHAPGPPPEPARDPAVAADRSLFVIQEHHARRHHFDLRLEMDGVLKSWAVPKEPSLDPEVKRLAVEVEDHPLEYATFEGKIPAGQYGAGQVRIWDLGTWEPVDAPRNSKDALAKGKLKFDLHGTRLHGRFLLTRMTGSEDNHHWLLRKLADDPAATPARRTRRSATAPLARKTPKPKPAPTTLPAPQLAKLATAVPRGADWLHELKFDGYRIFAAKRAGTLTLVTRSGLDWTHRFGDLANKLAALSDDDFLIDGEIVAFDAQHRSDFSRLQAALKSGRTEKLAFIGFDLLDFAGTDLARNPLIERKAALCKLIPESSPRILFSHHWRGHTEGRQLFEQACELKLEGIISKPAGDPYLSGSRHGWRKIKCIQREEFIICGYTQPKGGNRGFGALVLASYEHGQLTYRGKVGTGFSDERRLTLLDDMQPLRRNSCPLADDPGEDATWLRPELVAEVNFAELTADGRIRHGSFIALREDKPPTEVHMEAVIMDTGTNPPGKSKQPADPDRVAGVVISHPNRLLFPGTEITKHDVAAWYSRVAPLILPHLVNRPLAFLRAPSGIDGQIFFQKHFAARLPAGVKSKPLDPADPDSCVSYLTGEKGLISLVQHGVIEFHPWGAALAKPDQPDVLVWDLDPGDNLAWDEVLGAAFLLRDLLRDRGFHPLVKTSGGKGLHVQIFLTPDHSWDVLKPFTKAVATLLAKQNPQRLTIQASKSERTGRIYIDYLRNGRGATCVAPWSLRARPGATIATPLAWEQLPHILPSSLTLPTADPSIPLEWASSLASRDSVPLVVLKEFGIKVDR
jgi:bifunctional non-homologous end joining protein LigD